MQTVAAAPCRPQGPLLDTGYTPLLWQKEKTAKRPAAAGAGLQEVHRKAQGDPTESREDLDSLLNLIDRLDFNSFFNPKPDIRQLFEAAA